MKKLSFIIVMLMLNSGLLFSQVAINADGTAPASSSMLDVKSTSHGVLIPRMTFEQRNNIVNPEEGLIVFCTNCTSTETGALCIFEGGVWKNLTFTCPVPGSFYSGVHNAGLTEITWNWTAAHLATGYKLYNENAELMTDMGNVTTYTETGLNCNTSYERYIQSYNTCGYGSYINTSQSTLDVPIDNPPTQGTHIATLTSITWNWNTVPEATGYKWSTSDNYSTATDMFSSTTKTETGLVCGTSYTRYIWAYDECGHSASTAMTFSTLFNPAAPSSGTHYIASTLIIWKWNTVSGATGYKWNTTNNYATAQNMATSTSKTETGLTPGTAYTRYIWAYGTCGYSNETILTGTTNANWTCLDSITIEHVAGSVAPVTKTVTYGTVNNIPGATSKCWITSNLGADHQATAKEDATEASAGWYWQFNRMQGYKHDGTTRTPNTVWIYPLEENYDWLTANDPCALLLGSGWRIPTSTEWTNVDASGGWTSWTGSWNSALKLHGAGHLFSGTNGSLAGRGGSGNYWGSSQSSAGSAWNLSLYSGHCEVELGVKAEGFTIRCLRE